LYAIGEVANTGVHGANRLASNSLLECVVSGHRLAKVVREAPESVDVGAVDLDTAWSRQYRPDGPDLLAAVGRILWSAAGIVRDEHGLRAGLRALAALGEAHPASAALCTAELILHSALERRESRGAHFRSDYPQRDPAWDGRDTVLQGPAPVVPARC
jgi:L-aspartate oxidase